MWIGFEPKNVKNHNKKITPIQLRCNCSTFVTHWLSNCYKAVLGNCKFGKIITKNPFLSNRLLVFSIALPSVYIGTSNKKPVTYFPQIGNSTVDQLVNWKNKKSAEMIARFISALFFVCYQCVYNDILICACLALRYVSDIHAKPHAH